MKKKIAKWCSSAVVTVLSLSLGMGPVPAFAAAAAARESSPAASSETGGAPGADAIDMFRLYNPHDGEHVYTSDEDEIKTLLASGWNDEDIGWMAPSASSHPVYRLYNPHSHEHLYTLDQHERDTLKGIGWNDEDVKFNSADEAGGVPIYRLFNPYEDGVAAHHYTTNDDERAALVEAGWRDEGPTLFGMASDPIDDNVVEFNKNVKVVDVLDWEEDEPALASEAADDEGAPGSYESFEIAAGNGLTAQPIAVGDVVAGEPNNENAYGEAILVSNISAGDDGGMLVEGSVPELDDLVDHVDVSGEVDETKADIDYAPGVTPIDDGTADPQAMTLSIDPASIVDESGAAVLQEYSYEFGEGITLTFDPDIDYDFTYRFFKLRKAEMVATLDTEIRVDDVRLEKEFSKELFTLTFSVPNTLGAVKIAASFSLVASANASINVRVTSHVEQGFRYEGGKFQNIKNYEKPSISANFEGSARAGVQPDAMLKILGVNTAYLGIEGGVGLDGDVKAEGADIKGRITAYLYAKLLLNKKQNAAGDFLKKIFFPTEITIFDREHSPLWEYTFSI